MSHRVLLSLLFVGSAGCGTTEPEPPTLDNFSATMVTAAGKTSCAISPDRQLFCWGSFPDLGDLADSSCILRLGPTWFRRCLKTPTAVPELGLVAEVALGGSLLAERPLLCALESTGDLRCTGNFMGVFDQVASAGDGFVPYGVPGRMANASVANSHWCALDDLGTAYCWGGFLHGKRGIRQPIMGGDTWSLESNVVAGQYLVVEAGFEHSCGLKRDGQIRCWGHRDRVGSLGAPLTGSEWCGSLQPCVTQPTPIASGGRFLQLAVGAAHSCGLDDTRSVWCWGRNTFGQLGLGSTNDAPEPRRVAVPEHAVAIAAGAAHTCVVTVSGAVWCWGWKNAMSADTSDTVITAPLQILFTGRARSVVAGSDHTCLLDEKSHLYCWGQNDAGQLGVDDLEPRAHPTPVQLPAGAS